MSEGETIAPELGPAQATERTVSDAARLAPGWASRAASRPRATLLRPPPAPPRVPPVGRIDLYA